MDTSYLTTQVTTIIGQLHGLFDEIGVPNHERESRETELFTALSETLHNQLKIVNGEKGQLTEEANRLIKTIRQMETSLEDKKATDEYQLENDDLKVTLPLMQCLEGLKAKYNAVAKVHRQRFEEVKKLAEALESYSSHLEPSFVKIALPSCSNSSSPPPTFDLSSSYVASLDKEFSKVYEEYQRRIKSVQSTADDIVNLWAELGTPQAQTESSIIKYYRDAPEQLGLHQDDMKRLDGKRDRLIEEKRARERRLKELRATVEGLWDRLGVEEPDRKRFLAANRGCGLRVINEYESELDRLNELKRQNLHLFVEDARFKLQELWDSLYFSEEEMLDFAPAFSDVYSDALLSAHEAEIARLEALKEQRAPTLQLVDKHRSLVKDRDDLAASSQDASRLLLKPQKGEKRDPTRLLREEKMRKRIAKDLPKVEAELRRGLERWEDEYGRPFLVHGIAYLDELAAAAEKTLPPRSKTPSAGPTYASTTKKVPLKSAPEPAASRAGSVAASVTRSQAPSRAGTATPGAKTTPGTGAMRRNPLASSVITTGGRTPSKIPARVPLGATRNGGNSPERRPPMPKSEGSYDSNTIRSMGPPRAPPPKMRDLFEPPKLQETYQNENTRCASVASSTDSRVRPVSPEDVYDDRERMSYVDHSMMQSNHHNYTDSRYENRQYMAPADSRQISTTSTTNTGTSGSENWETFDDASEPEVDASSAYHAKLRAAKNGKRFTPEGVYTPPGKKFRSAYGHPQPIVEDQQGRRMATGSESAWTDEDAF
ncbi:uncharacterized protein KY384_004819 [Bacidia gigantensis]|uniref:uncharacterized protein n=1 Tax=Bacidia gigantensis TaxID=2732470 RepID=UPI001D03AA0A|nr:uncharacterized protein KY384_004819 [Bacidia gigantensis]KAG8530317.1 hypothetical protein KY384_004819 [Bacidia gigantensis]